MNDLAIGDSSWHESPPTIAFIIRPSFPSPSFPSPSFPPLQIEKFMCFPLEAPCDPTTGAVMNVQTMPFV